MNPQDEKLGGRIPLVKPDELTSAQRPLYDSINASQVPWAEKAGFVAKTQYGSLVGPFNVSLQSPAIASAFAALQSAEAANTTLNERTRQVVILTVGSIWKSQYELYAHKAVARKAGIPEAAIEAVATGGLADVLTEEEQTAQAFTLAITRDHQASNEIFDRAKETFGVRGIVDILFLAGCYDVVCSLLNAFQVPVPETQTH